MILFHTSTHNERIIIEEQYEDGSFGQIPVSTNNEELAQFYMKYRRDTFELGEEKALEKWGAEEAVERRKLGLEVKETY